MTQHTLSEHIEAISPQLWPALTAPHTLKLRITHTQVEAVTLQGIQTLFTLSSEERQRVETWAQALLGERLMATQQEEGLWVQVLATKPITLQLSARFAAPWTMQDFQTMVPLEASIYLQSLVAMGHNLLIVGESGFEEEYGAALCLHRHQLLMRTPTHTITPAGVVTADQTLPGEQALTTLLTLKRAGGFSHLFVNEPLSAEALCLLSQSSGVLWHIHSLEQLLSIANTHTALRVQLGRFFATIVFEKTLDGMGRLARIYEFHPALDEAAGQAILIAERGVNDPMDEFHFIRMPQMMRLLMTHGMDELVELFQEMPFIHDIDAMGDGEEAHTQDDHFLTEEERRYLAHQKEVPADENEEVAPLDLAPSKGQFFSQTAPSEEHSEQEESAWEVPYSPGSHDLDPGWELDAAAAPDPLLNISMTGKHFEQSSRAPLDYQESDFDGLPGQSMVLEQPLSHLSSKSKAAALRPGATPKKSFAALRKERHHRYPPVSLDGSPTLTPPFFQDVESSDDKKSR